MTRLRRSTSLHYFTLIEMLVVIAIIALLAAILMPALRKSIKEAREVVCMNNIHQLCVAAITYKEDYYGDYPPPVVVLEPNVKMSRAHPHDLHPAVMWYIAPYIGGDPSRFDPTAPTALEERQIPRVLLCPFNSFHSSSINNPAVTDPRPLPIYALTYTGYGYFGRLEWLLPGYSSHTSVPEAFKRKYADRRCDPDAALWGDTVSWQNWGQPQGAYTHTYSGRPRYIWDGPNSVVFGYFERQNMGRADGSVIIRWASEVNPVPSNVGLTGWGRYHWWYY